MKPGDPNTSALERERPERATSETKRAERATGIEPAFSAWEADVLPLYDARVVMRQACYQTT